MKRIESLDGVRGTAILLVILFHGQVLGCGWYGVQLFFALSGYLITNGLLRERGRSLVGYLGTFYRKRILRIFPLYFGFLFLVAVGYLALGKPELLPAHAPYLLTFTYNYRALGGAPPWSYPSNFLTHLWSLSAEEQYYVTWPLIVFICNRHVLRRIIYLLIVAGPIVRHVQATLLAAGYPLTFSIGEIVYESFLSHLDAFAWGALLCLRPLPRLGERHILPFVAVIVLAAGYISEEILRYTGQTNYRFTAPGYPLAPYRNFQHVWGFSLLNLLSASILDFAISNGHKAKFLNLRWLRYLGKVSFGLYIFHMPIFCWLVRQPAYTSSFPIHLIGFVGGLTLSVALAHVAYRFWEEPFLKLK